MATIKPLRVAVALLACLLFAAAARAQQYTIKLQHAEKVGDTMPLDVDGKDVDSTTTTVAGQAPQHSDETLDAQLTGERKVLAVDEKGNPIKLSITVSKCTSGGKPVIPPASVVIAERTGAAPATYSIGGAPADEATAKVMALVIEMEDPTSPDMDPVFGTTQPQKSGDSWPINIDTALKMISGIGFPLKKENVSGTTTLVGLEKIDGKDVLKIKGNMTGKNLSGPGPGGMKVQSGDITVTFNSMISAADATVPLRDVEQNSMHLIGQVSGPNGEAITLELKFDRSLTIRMGAGVKPDVQQNGASPPRASAGNIGPVVQAPPAAPGVPAAPIAPTAEVPVVDAMGYTTLGTRLPASLVAVGGFTQDPMGVHFDGHGVIRTEKADYLDRDFVFDVIFTIKAGDRIAFMGIGEGEPAGTEMRGSVYLRMHGPKLANGLIALGRGPTGGMELGHHNAGGTYLARIEKKGTAVTFSVDVDWNGKDFKPSCSHTFEDIKKYAGKFDNQNTRLFFGNNGHFRQFRIVEHAAGAAEETKEGPTPQR